MISESLKFIITKNHNAQIKGQNQSIIMNNQSIIIIMNNQVSSQVQHFTVHASSVISIVAFTHKCGNKSSIMNSP